MKAIGAYYGNTAIEQGAAGIGGLGDDTLRAYADGVLGRGDDSTPGGLTAFNDGSLGEAPDGTLSAYADGILGAPGGPADGSLTAFNDGSLGADDTLRAYADGVLGRGDDSTPGGLTAYNDGSLGAVASANGFRPRSYAEFADGILTRGRSRRSAVGIGAPLGNAFLYALYLTLTPHAYAAGEAPVSEAQDAFFADASRDQKNKIKRLKGMIRRGWLTDVTAGRLSAFMSANAAMLRGNRLQGIGEYFVPAGLGEYFSGLGIVAGTVLDMTDPAVIEEIKTAVSLMVPSFTGSTAAQATYTPSYYSNGLWDPAASAAWFQAAQAMGAAANVGAATLTTTSGANMYPNAAGVAAIGRFLTQPGFGSGYFATNFPRTAAFLQNSGTAITPPYFTVTDKARGDSDTGSTMASMTKMTLYGLGAVALIGVAVVATSKKKRVTPNRGGRRHRRRRH